MARFRNSVWNEHHIKTWPKGARWLFPIPGLYKLWSYPYNTGSVPGFWIELTKYPPGKGPVHLNNLPFKVRFTDTGEVSSITSIDRYTGKSKGFFDQYTVTGYRSLEIWVGDPKKSNAVRLIAADGVNPTTIMLTVIGGIVGGVVTAAVIFLLGL